MNVSPLLEVTHLHKSFGALTATNDVSLQVFPGEVHALIGPNGAGKTTFVAQLTGVLKQDSGHITFDGELIDNMSIHARALKGLIRTFQITSIFPDFTVEDNIALVYQIRHGHSFRFWRNARRDQKLRQPARELLKAFDMLDLAALPAKVLAHSQKKHLELLMGFAAEPKLLLLDEPMAGMSSGESKTVLNALMRMKGDTSLLLIEHDMDVVFSIADRVSVLVDGALLVTDTPMAIKNNEQVRKIYLGQ